MDSPWFPPSTTTKVQVQGTTSGTLEGSCWPSRTITLYFRRWVWVLVLPRRQRAGSTGSASHTLCLAPPCCWGLWFRTPSLPLHEGKHKTGKLMSRELHSVLRGLYHGHHFINMKFRESRLPSRWLAEPGFKSRPRQPKYMDLKPNQEIKSSQ